MLNGATNSTKNMQQQSATMSTKSISPSCTSPSSNSIKNIKCEPFSALSPCNENVDDQNLIEDNSNNSNKNNNNLKLDSLIRENTSSRSSMLRQNSNGSVSTGPNVGVTSPANGSDHSNSSNQSASHVQAVDNPADMLQDLNNEKGAKKKLGISNLHGSEEENSKSASNIEKSTNPIKDETETLKNLVNVKKEEGTTSPVMSPVGFGSIGNIGNSSMECAVTSGKLCDGPNVAAGSGNSDKMTGGQSGCSDDTGLTGPSNETCTGSTGSHIQPNSFPNNSPSGNSMEYMQQQNHIFVFSTQLANKGAESVISGHYPTIIAYHCTQPATKNFLEEFFMKNPMKVSSKLHRQNVMGNMPGGPKWMGGNNVSKLPQKCNGNMNFPANNVDNKSNIPNLRSQPMGGFPETSDGVVGGDLLLWDQTRNNLENPGIDVKLLEGVDSIVSNHNIGENAHLLNKAIGLIDGGDSSIPSLQGVKVPDENLTPQQRQHREEQLAKLKKMNQFLFPENGSEFRPDNGLQAPNQLNKLPPDGMILNTPGAGSNMASPITNSLTSSMRNMPSNMLGQSKGPGCSSDNIAGLGEDALLAADILGSHEMPGMSCNMNKTNMALNNQHGFPCGPNAGMGGMPSTMQGNMQANTMPCHGSNGPSGLLSNSPEIMATFNQGNNESGSKPMGAGMHNPELNQPGMAEIEWSRLQNQFFEEKVKSNKPGTENASLSNPMCRSNSSNVNSNIRPNGNSCGTGTAAPAINNQPGRTGQGPPPPYHSTQRSASVPIATQSPNPASPNNPTSNLSLPSPRTSGIISATANSPNLEGIASTVPSTTSTISTVTTTAGISTTMANANTQGKGNFQLEGSPTNTNSVSANRGGRNNMNQFNSNPSTPLSRMSPKDLDSFHSTVSNGDPKNVRPSPQRSRTPLMGPSNNSNIQEASNIEGRFPSASPGLNFPPNNATPGNAYKGPGNLERQNSVPSGPQFCRRADNLPLNPNSNRLPQNKLIHQFDPISSLAQMSQQLTSCVSMNPGLNSNSSSLGGGVNDMNMSANVNTNMDGMMGSLDAGMEHCSPAASNNMSMPQHMSNGVPFMGNNCHPMMGPMTQRLLNPKMCGAYNTPGGAGIREGPGNFHGVMGGPSHRMMSRMPLNFGNFSPNVQVKASTPNTIQYMPVRPQNNNNNMRVAPSLDFLQRYANPGAGNVIDSGQPGGIVPSDPNKLGNSGNNNSGMNFFQNCNQIGGPIGVDQDEMLGHDINMGSHNAMIRGMRPMRQHGMGPGGPSVSGPRMQGPSGNMVPQFSGSPDPLECNDNSAMFNSNSSAGGQGQMFNNTQQKQNKGMGASSGPNNGQLPNSGIIQNEHNSAMPLQHSSMMLNQNTMNLGNNPSPAVCNVGNGNVNYKPFVGPASNDLKYPQQYLSFQQQLYATSTRNQQGNNMGNNPTSNSTFFTNK